MPLSTQALTALVGYVAVAIAMFIPMKPADPSNPEEYHLQNRLLVVAMMIIPAALSVYTINCLVEGSCSVWSWIHSIIVFLWALLILSVAIYGAFVSVPAPAEPEAPAAPAAAAKAAPAPAVAAKTA
jgi:ABC-type transport system involved in multi-copper enzyme maturation permease subunit